MQNSHLIQDAKRLRSLDDRVEGKPGASKGRLALLETISSTFNIQIFFTNIVFLVMFWLCQKNRTKNSHI